MTAAERLAAWKAARAAVQADLVAAEGMQDHPASKPCRDALELIGTEIVAAAFDVARVEQYRLLLEWFPERKPVNLAFEARRWTAAHPELWKDLLT